MYSSKCRCWDSDGEDNYGKKNKEFVISDDSEMYCSVPIHTTSLTKNCCWRCLRVNIPSTRKSTCMCLRIEHFDRNWQTLTADSDWYWRQTLRTLFTSVCPDTRQGTTIIMGGIYFYVLAGNNYCGSMEISWKWWRQWPVILQPVTSKYVHISVPIGYG